VADMACHDASAAPFVISRDHVSVLPGLFCERNTAVLCYRCDAEIFDPEERS
jgi:hypothetical protein